MPRTMTLSAEAANSTRSSKFAGQRVHFTGIGGCGMSGLASILLDCGAIVTGSEAKPNAQSFALAKRGVQISRDQIGELLNKEIDLVVRTAAVADNNREFIAARAFGLRTIKYAELLGEVMAERFGIAIAGTHGKSTTTAMIAYALINCGVDPSFVVGGTVPQLDGAGSRSGAGDAFVAEACEFDRSFHALRPRVAIITNIEEDHLDCYKNIDEIIESFRTFARIVPADGLIIACGTDHRVIETLAGISTNVELVAIGEGFSWSVRPTGLRNGYPTGVVSYKGREICKLKLSLPGEHNLLNATMAIAACNAAGVDPTNAAAALADFIGVDRRMTTVGEFNGATVIDDYGHHPTEIRVTLRALREKFQPKRLLCVFQPHQHSRTRFLLDDFAKCFADADETILADIYFVRDSESEKHRVSSNDLVSRIKDHGQRARHLAQFSEITDHLRANVRAGDLVVTMGAGNVWEIGRELVGS